MLPNQSTLEALIFTVKCQWLYCVVRADDSKFITYKGEGHQENTHTVLQSLSFVPPESRPCGGDA